MVIPGTLGQRVAHIGLGPGKEAGLDGLLHGGMEKSLEERYMRMERVSYGFLSISWSSFPHIVGFPSWP